MLSSALKQYRHQQRVSVLGLRQMRRAAPRGSRTVARVLAGYQAASIRLALESAPEVLAEQGIDPAQSAQVNPAALLSGDRAAAMFDAAATDAAFDTLALSLIQDAARTAAVTDLVTRRAVTGYVRTLNGPTCSRCAVLAGRVYRYSQGFQRHPRCFPAGVVVSGPGSEAASRRWFEGELVVLTTASGQQLPVTGNHPVLTSRGWLPANLINEGDEVVRSTLPEGASALVVPNHHEVPSRIEDVWGSLSVSGFDAVESAPEDFHGDGQHGQVHVVRADSALDGRVLTECGEHRAERLLASASDSALALDGEGSSVLLDLRDRPEPRRAVRGRRLVGTLLGGQTGVSDLSGLAHVASFDPSAAQQGSYGSSRNPVGSGQRVLAGAGLVSADDLFDRQSDPRPRWDAPTISDVLEQRAGYAAVGIDLLNRLSGQIELDRVVLSRSIGFSGHVFSLTSSEGWHSANSLIVSNCDCLMTPTDAGSGRALTTATNLVVDTARREAGLVVGSSVVARNGRLTPQAVLASTPDRAAALSLLRRLGYITS